MLNLIDISRTCSTLFERPVFCDNCFRSLASGFWLMAKYDFIVRSWWCLNEVRIRLLRACCDRLPPEPGDWLPSYDKSNDVAVRSVCISSERRNIENKTTIVENHFSFICLFAKCVIVSISRSDCCLRRVVGGRRTCNCENNGHLFLFAQCK